MPSPICREVVFRDYRAVSYVRLAILSRTDQENHYCIFLVHDGDQTSTRCHVMDQQGRRQAILQWTNHDYTLANSAVTWWDIPVKHQFTVSDIGHMIYDYRRHKYEMDAARGCRWWAYTILSDMAQCGYICRCVPCDLYPKFLHFYDRHGERSGPLPMVEGWFY